MLGDAAARFDVAGFDADDAGAADGTRGQMGEMPFGEPSCAEYWHIGDIMMRLRVSTERSVKGEQMRL